TNSPIRINEGQADRIPLVCSSLIPNLATSPHMLVTQTGEIQLTQREKKELLALADRIIESGVLGKSKVYSRILRYLVDCTVQGTSAKETSIATDVLERAADFDISRDSIVRVYIYQLRNKLGKYFEQF